MAYYPLRLSEIRDLTKFMQLIHGAARLERRRVPPYSSRSSHQPKGLLRKKTPLYMFMNMMTASSLHLKIHKLNNDSILQYPCLENPMG